MSDYKFSAIYGDPRHIGFVSGIMAAGLAAGAEVLQVRWAPAVTTQKLAIFGLTFGAANDGTAFAAGVARFNINKATAWTVAGTGGAVVDLSTTRGKLNTDSTTYAVPEVRAATTAALGTGTKVTGVDTAMLMGGVTAVAGVALLAPLDFFNNMLFDKPLILSNQEGILISATVPATGTWRFAGNILMGTLV